MIYALNDHGMCEGGDESGVLEYENVEAAQDALRTYIMTAAKRGRLKYDNLVQMFLFSTREDAATADQTAGDEVMIDETKAFRTLEWERGFGFNF